MVRLKKTITIRDVQKLAERGLEILIKKGRHPEGNFGLYYPEEDEIRVYLPQHSSKKEIEDTILHEYVHALEGQRGFKGKISHGEIDIVVNRTVRRRPKVIEFIKELYELDY